MMKHDKSTISNVPNPPADPSEYDRATFVKSQLKAGARRILGRNDDDSLSNSEEHLEIFDDAVFDPRQALDDGTRESSSLRSKLHRGVQGLAVTIQNPRRAARSRYARVVAGNLSGGPGSLDKKHDTELLEAHDALHTAIADAGPDSREELERRQRRHTRGSCLPSDVDRVSSAQKVEDARNRFQEVQDKQDSLRAAWILGRHVRRIRVAEPIRKPPTKSDFTIHSADRKARTVQWGQYLAQLALWHTRSFTPYLIDDFDELPFDMKDFSLAVERLVTVSAPWQNFLLDVRSVYLWTDPRRTVKFVTIYAILWYFQHIMTAVFAWVLVATVLNRYDPSKIETIRKRVNRAQNDQAKAQAWGEMIERHGKYDWIEPFLDEMGPLIQLELTDFANLLEILQSFYRWERPKKTIATLFFFATCLLTSLFADMNFCVKLIWLGVGYLFFVSFPLCARYPRYRRLFNPIYWVFWDIPNLAEIAFAQLQEKAILRDADRLQISRVHAVVEDEPYASSLEGDSGVELDGKDDIDTKANDIGILQALQNRDHITFRAVDSVRRTSGRLMLQRHGLWYSDKSLKSYYSYSQLSEVRKVNLGTANSKDTSRMARFAERIQQSTSIAFLPSGIEFIFRPAAHAIEGPTPELEVDSTKAPDNLQLALTVSESDRDKIFSLVISWSNIKWQPQFTMNERNRLSEGSDHPTKQGKGNEALDTAIKSFVQ